MPKTKSYSKFRTFIFTPAEINTKKKIIICIGQLLRETSD